MQINRRVVHFLILALFTCSLLLSACQPTVAATPTAVPPTAPPATAAPTEPSGTVSFMIFGDPAELKAYQTLVSAFEAKHPTIKIELIHIPGQSDYRKRLAADFAAGTPADVVLMNYRRIAPFASQGMLEPLNDYLANSKLFKESDFYPEAITPFYWQGQLMCIPQNISSLVVYYNKTLFDQANVAYPSDDWNWEQFIDTAQRLTKDLDGNGRTDQYGLGTEVTLIRLAPFVWQSGGDLLDDPQNPTRLMLDTPEALEAIEFMTDWQVRYHVVPDAEAEASEDSLSRFENGRIGMFLSSRRETPTFREITGFDWDIAPLPQYKQKAGVLHSDGYCMPASVKDKNLVWTFIEFANSAEGQTIIAASGRTVPSIKAVAESPAFLDPTQKPAHSQVFLDTIPYIRPVPVLTTWVDIESVVGEELERAYYGNATVYDAVLTMIQRVQVYFSENE